MRTTNRVYDLSPLYSSFVGLDRMAGLLDAATAQSNSTAGYPPYNVARIDDDAYRIELAVAGFSQDDLSIESEQNRLTISGRIENKSANDEAEYLHRGIAERSFERRFQLADHVFVQGAKLENGLLVISLKRELPEALKPRRIEIGQGNGLAEHGEKLTHSETGGKQKAA